MNDKQQCYYVPGATSIIDIINNDGLTSCMKKTKADVMAEYPEVTITTVGEAAKLIRERADIKYISPAKEITEDRYNYALEVLPPLHYQNNEHGTTFKLSEFNFSTITNIYCHTNGKYYELSNHATLKHDDIINLCA